MTTASAATTATRTADGPYRLTFLRALRSEWIKLATLRSTWWSIAIVAVLTVGIALLIAANMNFGGAIRAVVSPIQFTVLLAGILGAIAVTGEYSTGMIRSTLTADPVRGCVLAAKAVAVALLMFVASLVIFMVAAVAIAPILAENRATIDWGDAAHSWLPILAAAFSMSVFAVIGVAFGFLLRSGAGAIAATVGLLFIAPIVLSILSGSVEWVHTLLEYMPMSAAQNLILPTDGWGLSVPEAFATLCGWVVAGMVGAWSVLRVRDA